MVSFQSLFINNDRHFHYLSFHQNTSTLTENLKNLTTVLVPVNDVCKIKKAHHFHEVMCFFTLYISKR